MTGENATQLKPKALQVYHVFLASPSDVTVERAEVHAFFDEFNRTTATAWGVRFEVVDRVNYATAGVGRPQELLTRSTLERFKSSLALVIGIIAQRFGSPTDPSDSGTQKEFEWAIESHRETSWPEVKLFFRNIERFVATSSDLKAIQEDVEQWKSVTAFRDGLSVLDPPITIAEFQDNDTFRRTLQTDLGTWLHGSRQPWINLTTKRSRATQSHVQSTQFVKPTYYEHLFHEFRWLDISGIDQDEAIQIPLSEMYVRLRVMLDEVDALKAPDIDSDGGPIDIRSALNRFRKLVVVGDPGSGKSTFLKYIALIIARSIREHAPALAADNIGRSQFRSSFLSGICRTLSDISALRSSVLPKCQTLWPSSPTDSRQLDAKSAPMFSPAVWPPGLAAFYSTDWMK